MSGKKDCSVQVEFEVSQLDNSGAAGAVVHNSWPAHVKRSANSAHRKSRRQSVLAKEFEKFQALGCGGMDTTDGNEESTDVAIAREHGPAHRDRRRSSVRRASVNVNQIAECRTKRRQSLLPVLRAASKGEEVTVINGIKSGESVRETAEYSTSAFSIKSGGRRSSSGHGRATVKKEASESFPASEELSSSVANLKRRSRTSSLKEGVASEVSGDLSKSRKLEDQINLQHLVELMTVFNVSHRN